MTLKTLNISVRIPSTKGHTNRHAFGYSCIYTLTLRTLNVSVRTASMDGHTNLHTFDYV